MLKSRHRRGGPISLTTALESVRQSNGSWKALCPAHEDREPSLSVTEGDDGRALLKCFAGCDTQKIVGALGLEMKDLFESRNGYKKELHSTPRKHLQPCNPAASRTTPRLKACQSSFYRSRASGTRSIRNSRRYASRIGM